MRDEMITRKAVMESLTREYNRRYSKNSTGLALAYIEKAVNDAEAEWIPIDDPPKDDNYILLSFENFSVPAIGRYEQAGDGSGAYYIGDEMETALSQDMIVNGWLPLPKRKES